MKRKNILLFLSITFVLIGFCGAICTVFYGVFSYEKNTLRFKAPYKEEIRLEKGQYLFCYEFKSYFDGVHYDLPITLSDDYEVKIFDDQDDQLPHGFIKQRTSYKESTWQYKREALALFSFVIKQSGDYKVEVARQTEDTPSAIFTIYKDINIFLIILVASCFSSLLFIGAILFLIWLISCLSCAKKSVTKTREV